MLDDLQARDSQGRKQAVARLASLIALGESSQTQVIQHVLNRSIVDKLVDPRSARMELGMKNELIMRYLPKGEAATVSGNALGQMCGVAEIPKTYVNKLLTKCAGMDSHVREQLTLHLFNTHFHEGKYLNRRNERTKFLHRTLNGELWGFLSRNYNRNLGVASMLRPFIEQCRQHGAKPTEAHTAALKTTVKCVLPTIFEPIDGEFMAFGATYTNSDFGSGSLMVQGVVLRISSGTSVVLENKMRKIHLGALIQESDIVLSEGTVAKESAAHASAVKDMVNDVFSEDSLKRTLTVISAASENKLNWQKILSQAKEVLTKEELGTLEDMLKGTQAGVVDLPPVQVNKSGDPEANAWWAAAAIGSIANAVTDVERKVDIQELAGKWLV